ncbi:RHS repeat-associated core domain-containing protein [Lysobacter sp. 5GHs7-4]|uniref:RHS repeat domain-containing protein n=1 Tax=Lysobacter sp. 5GHs7-4 TaxID=2904253 RepID=UPI001E65DDD5|nr:RHS repeat-associated core domain-containing protein [Lysobacter sp. 5GHs7-4]UHQ23257.1 RHS repeat-associated core domain-containing protein [Lysobacter sp. 5GHs7-4]
MQSYLVPTAARPAIGARANRRAFTLFSSIVLIALMWAAAGSVAAQSMTTEAEYQKKIQAASTITAAGEGVFGNRTTDATGKTEFVNIDIDVPGSSGLPVQFGRRLPIDWWYLPEQLGGLGNWDVEVPYIQTTVSSNMGWSVAGASSPNRYKRCSFPGLPAVEGLLISSEEVSHGYRLHVPGVGDEPMLVDHNLNTDPTNGSSYPWVLKSMGRVGCLPTVKNGYPGEGFYLLTTDGVKYYFDVAVERTAMKIRKGPKGLPGYTMARKNIYLLASRIEDRFGNYVNYTYVDGRLSSIAANDGRQITVQYGAGSVTASSHGRSWTYTLTNGHLTQVANPDGSTWQYPAYGFSSPYDQQQSDAMGLSYFDPGTMCQVESSPDRFAGEFPFTVKHPSGAQATFQFEGRRFHRSRVPYICFIDFFDHEVRVAGGSVNFTATLDWELIIKMSEDGYSWEAAVDNVELYESQGLVEEYVDVGGHARIGTPNYFDVFSLKSLTISGPGIASQVTGYAYQQDTYPYCGIYNHQTGTPDGPTCQEDPCAGQACGDGVGRTTTITLPNGAVVKKRYGVIFDKNEGMLLSEQVIGAGGAEAQRVDYTYVQDEQVGQQPFPSEAGYGFGDRMESKLRPLKSTSLVRDGVTYTSAVGAFDRFARPTSVTRASTINGGHTRTDTTQYHDDLSKWVLGQTKLSTTNGIEVGRTEFTANAQPYRSFRYGETTPSQTLTYNADGTVATVTDGNNNVTTLSNWKRGIPQTIQHPATAESPSGSTQSASVNDSGWIDWVTDENGYKTSYQYDTMGRLSRIVYPTDDTVAWNDKLFSFQQVNQEEMGVPAGHWRQTVVQGNYEKLTLFDALWRPILQYERDNADSNGTYRIVRNAFDHDGRQTFASYPRNPYADGNWNLNTGTWTTYDALGRATKVEQDSELGKLTTTTAYAWGGDIVVTNPRGHQTRTRYAAWDQPTTDYPIEIIQPVATTTIDRDPIYFLRPKSVTRSGTYAGQPVQALRRYTYDGLNRLCRTDEPETGSTVMGYDANDNMTWSAAGLSGLNSVNCDHVAAYNAGRTVTRNYDARNRITQLGFPDGLGNQSWTYTKDGLPATITTYNGSNNTWPWINAYHYNKRRLLDGQGDSISQPGWYTWSLGYGYDRNGHLSVQTYPTGLAVGYAPNALGQATQVATVAGSTTTGTYASGVSYYPNGAIKQFTYGNGLLHAMWQNGRQLPWTVDDGGLSSFSYTYDENGNPTQITDNAQGANFHRYLEYDAQDRLLRAGSLMFGGTNHWIDYAYDPIDNLRSVSHPGVREHSYWYDANNRLTNVRNAGGATVTGLGYDVQGNLNNKNGQAYWFTFGNRLREVTGKESYAYDGLGRRVQTMQADGTVRLFQYSQAGQYLFGSKQTPAGVQTTQENIYLAGSLIATVDHNWPSNTVIATKYHHTDALGSPVATTNAAGALIERTNYEPYGSAINKTVNGIGYTGHVMDGATGLTYMQQRYYDPTLGRFLSVDPVTANSGTGSNFNRYWYGNNNPYRFTDPDGRQSTENVRAQPTGIPYIDWFMTPSDERGSQRLMMKKQLAFEMSLPRSWRDVALNIGIALSAGAGAAGRGAARSMARSGARGASGPLETTSGNIWHGNSSGSAASGGDALAPMHPRTQRALDIVQKPSRTHGQCCEIDAINKALNAGDDVRGAKMGPVKLNESGRIIPPCSTCREVKKTLGIE